jgi:hypothetical protein
MSESTGLEHPYTRVTKMAFNRTGGQVNDPIKIASASPLLQCTRLQKFSGFVMGRNISFLYFHHEKIGCNV